MNFMIAIANFILFKVLAPNYFCVAAQADGLKRCNRDGVVRGHIRIDTIFETATQGSERIFQIKKIFVRRC